VPDKVATFNIRLDSNASDVAREDSAELQALRDKIRGSSDAIKQMGAAYRSLRGSTDDVKGAKGQLKAMLDAERDSLSAANLALLKQGTTYEKLADQARKAAKAKEKLELRKEAEELAKLRAGSDKLREGLDRAGGPVSELAGKFRTLTGLAGGAGGAIGLAAFAAASAVAIFVGLTAAIIGGAVALAKWIIEGGNAARTLGLVREAASGSAENARNLGDQIDLLSHKVATPKAKLEALGVTLTKTLSGSQVSGQGIIDTFNAVAQASEAMGDDVGSQLGEIVTRAKRFGRVQISPFEIQGTGPRFKDIAAELAVQMHVGIKTAETALMQGRVKVDDAAKAIRAAVEKRFGEINARKLLDLDVQLAKFHENLDALRKGVNMEPLLKGLASILSLFDTSTVSGAALRDTITALGDVIGKVFGAAVPDIKSFAKSMIVCALDVVIAGLRMTVSLLRAKDAIGKFIGGFDGWFTARNVILGMTAAVAGLTAAFVALAVATIGIWGPFALIAAAVAGIVLAIPRLIRAWDAVNDWAKGAAKSMEDLGRAIVEGIANGLTKAGHFLLEKVEGLAESVKDAFRGALHIGSPSKVFSVYGENTAEGYTQGIERGTPGAHEAAEAMAPSAPAGGAASGRAGGASVNVGGIHIHVGGGGNGEAQAKALSEPSFLSALTKAVTDALSSAGIPTDGAPA